jgi:hypothetical protein
LLIANYTELKNKTTRNNKAAENKTTRNCCSMQLQCNLSNG